MVTYTASKTALAFTYLTASDKIRNFLAIADQDYALKHNESVPSYPANTDAFVDSSTTIAASDIACVVRNPYVRFISRWVRNCEHRTKEHLQPLGFSEYVTDYNNNHFVVPLNLNGLWETRTANGIDFGVIASQITAAGLTPNTIKILKLESISEDIKSIITVDTTDAYQLSAYNHLIVNGAAVLNEDPNWKAQYNQSIADTIYNAFAADFTAFGYSRDSWK
jgi:hypothetical protein